MGDRTREPMSGQGQKSVKSAPLLLGRAFFYSKPKQQYIYTPHQNTKYRTPNNPYQIHQSQFTYQQTHKHIQIHIRIHIQTQTQKIIFCFFEHVHTFL